MVKVDLTGAQDFFGTAGPDYAAAAEAHRLLYSKSGPGGEFTGWLELPRRMAEGELKAIQSAAARIRRQAQVLLVVGIGGSYLGARAGIELLRGPLSNLKNDGMQVFFLGNSLSADTIAETAALLEGKDFCVNVVSKSGSTLESALGFRVAKALLEEKYGSAAAKKRIYVTTDAEKGILHDLAVREGYERFTVPCDVGGRFSVLSAVGLLPMAVAGIDVEKLLLCAQEELEALNLRSPENPAWQYAAARQQLYRSGKSIELLVSYEPAFHFMGEWWKQLFGESEGKNGIGIFPATLEYNADLHSMGQYVQDGPRTMLETAVSFDAPLNPCKVPFFMGNPDGLNHLAGREFSELQRIARDGVKSAHISGGVPCIGLSVPKRDEAGFAALVCFFEMACALSAYMSGVNPFDQPGVEAYKAAIQSMLHPD